MDWREKGSCKKININFDNSISIKNNNILCKIVTKPVYLLLVVGRKVI
jgi:hypothetical protein